MISNGRFRRFAAILPKSRGAAPSSPMEEKILTITEAIKHPVVTGGIDPKTIGHAHGFFDAVKVLNVYNHRGKIGKMITVSFHEALELEGKIVSAWVPTYS